MKGALLESVAAQYVITVWINIFQNKTSILVSHVRHVPLWLAQLLRSYKKKVKTMINPHLHKQT